MSGDMESGSVGGAQRAEAWEALGANERTQRTATPTSGCLARSPATQRTATPSGGSAALPRHLRMRRQ